MPDVFETFRKVFAPARFNQEHEKRLKRTLGRARDADAALDAIDLIYNEGERYPTAYHLRMAIERVNARLELQAERTDSHEELGYGAGDDYDPAYGYEDPMRWRGPAVSFREWYAAQDAEMQARVRRVFPSLRVELP